MFAVYVLCGAQEKDAVRLTLEQIDVVRRMCTEYPDFELVTSVQGIVTWGGTAGILPTTTTFYHSDDYLQCY